MAPATGQVETISPSTAARPHMKRPDIGQATAYILPPPVCNAVRTPNTVPVRQKMPLISMNSKGKSRSTGLCAPGSPPMLHKEIPNDAQKSY